MMIFLMFESNELNPDQMNEINGHNMFSRVGPIVQFPSTSGLQSFELTNPNWGNNMLEVRAINENTYGITMMQILETHQTFRAAAGLSPFASYSFGNNLQFANDLLGADEDGYPYGLNAISIGFRIKVKKSNASQSMNWVSTCQ